MYYYHISLSPLAIISGPHDTQSEYIKTLTGCGNPELLNLADYHLVPLIEEEIGDDDDFGNPVITDAGVVLEKVQPTLAEVRRRKRARIAEICARKLEANITVDGVSYDVSESWNVMALMLAGHTARHPAATVMVRKRDGSLVGLTAAQMTALVDAVSTRSAACFANEKSLYDAIGTATRAQLRDMDLQAGWPG